MRSDVLTRHMKQHSKINESNPLTNISETNNVYKSTVLTQRSEEEIEIKDENNLKLNETRGGSKRKHDGTAEEYEALKKYLIEKTNEYKAKITLGENVYLILGEGEVPEDSLPREMKEALDIYKKQAQELYHNNVELKPWQTELLEYMDHPTQRQIIWIVGKSCGEGKSWFQKYVKSIYGTRKVVSGINLRASTPNICHVLSKQPLSTADIFLFNIGKAKKKTDAVNYEVLEDLKDGDAFAAKYNSQQLKIRTPNVVMVFSNEGPDTNQLAIDRWKLLYITDDNLEERQVIKNGNSTCTTKKKKKLNITEEQMQNLEDELCLNLCWCGFHVCNPKDEDNFLLGIDTAYLRSVNYDHTVKEKFRCEKCSFYSADMKDVNQHYMEHHRDTHMFPCWECDKKFKTIEELKTHYAKQHFDKKTTRDYSSFYA